MPPKYALYAAVLAMKKTKISVVYVEEKEVFLLHNRPNHARFVRGPDVSLIQTFAEFVEGVAGLTGSRFLSGWRIKGWFAKCRAISSEIMQSVSFNPDDPNRSKINSATFKHG